MELHLLLVVLIELTKVLKQRWVALEDILLHLES